MIQAYAAFEKGGELKPYEYQPSELTEDEVEIDVSHCGICHSDLSVINSEWGPTPYPLVAGHEVVGKIGIKGASVENLEVGDVVGLGWHSGYCGSCQQCEVGDHNLCANSMSTILGRHGGFADKVRAKAHSVVRVPMGLDLSTVGPLFCGGITVFNPLVQFNIQPTHRVGIIGIGGLGHMAVKFYRAWGCEVTAFTSNPEKTEELKMMGAHHVLNSRDGSDLADAQRSFDMIISTVNVSLNWQNYLELLAPRGRLHFVGATLEPLNIGVMSLLGRQLSVSASPIGSPHVIAEMLEFASRHQIEPIVEIFPFTEINQAIAHLDEGKARYRVVLSHQ